jgi:hypothetical protein
MAEKMTVHNPMGFPPKVTQLAMAPRMDSLEGRPIFLVDCRFDDGDVLMKQMQYWFRDNMPTVRTELRRKAGVHKEHDPELFEEIRSSNGAAIFGVGH